MTKEQVRFQVAVSVIQGIIEGKHGIIGEVVPAAAVDEAFRIADQFTEKWFEKYERERNGVTESKALSEDEKIRKALIELVYSDVNDLIGGVEKRLCVSHLEKQKEQIPSPLFKVGDKIKLKSEPKYPFREIIDIKNGAYYFDAAVHLPFKEQDKWEAEQKPAEWSEKDEKIREELYEYFRQLQLMSDRGFSPSLSLDDILSWLKSLRPQPHWKPSEEQMEALQHAIDACECEWGYEDSELRSLLSDLQTKL